MMIQQGVSDGGIGATADSPHSEVHGMTVGKVMDWYISSNYIMISQP
jgi:hypothetical protein